MRNTKKRSKYKNIKVVIDGIKFDSKKEVAHYYQLKDLLDEGKITNLALQPKSNTASSVILDGKRKPKSKQALIHDDEAMMIDKAVSMLKSDSPMMAKIIKKVYVDDKYKKKVD